ncbi:MAG: peptidoglycan DD-metalloendopeptidase family protein [Bacteroidetes bacterium]|nr:peptidoglycan DD-metalloendopeptidase family protein [Bacteroidota bacterium]
MLTKNTKEKRKKQSRLPERLLITLAFLLLINVCSKAQDSDSISPELQKTQFTTDTSFIYQIPFETEHSHMLVQGSHSMFSHHNQYASDFYVKPGTPVCASRSGVVIDVKSDSKVHGLRKKFLSKGNHIIIMHADSTFAAYWHLKHDGSTVTEGDTVQVGDIIGYSGNTGYSAFPHLHFMVFRKNENNKRITMPVRFRTQKGICYLKPGHKYCRPKRKNAQR